jgi:hypothetical protein
MRGGPQSDLFRDAGWSGALVAFAWAPETRDLSVDRGQRRCPARPHDQAEASPVVTQG